MQANDYKIPYEDNIQDGPILRLILADFQNSFTVTFSRKSAIKRSLNIPSHLKHVGVTFLAHPVVNAPPKMVQNLA